MGRGDTYHISAGTAVVRVAGSICAHAATEHLGSTRGSFWAAFIAGASSMSGLRGAWSGVREVGIAPLCTSAISLAVL